MSTVSKPFTFTSGTTILASEVNSDFDTLYSEFNGSISNANISASAGIVDTKLDTIATAGKVNVSALTVSSQATGDILYASSGSAWARLGVGSNGDFLVLASGLPAWETRIATQAETETATSATKLATVGRMQYHPGVAKAWCRFNGTGTPAMAATHNMDSSITDNGTGDYTVAFTTDFSSVNYAVAGMAKGGAAGSDPVFVNIEGDPGAGSINIEVCNHDATRSDSAVVTLVAFGDQA